LHNTVEIISQATCAEFKNDTTKPVPANCAATPLPGDAGAIDMLKMSPLQRLQVGSYLMIDKLMPLLKRFCANIE
jgi:hypothetical protein